MLKRALKFTIEPSNYHTSCTVIILITIISIAVLLTSCNSTYSTDSEPSQPPFGTSSSTSEMPPPEGETKMYKYQNLEIKLTNVISDRTETMTDDGGNEWKYTVITYYPGAKFTVVKADMSDATYTADGNSYPQWGILLDSDTNERIEITDDMQQLDITSDMKGIYNLEASLYVFGFEDYTK